MEPGALKQKLEPLRRRLSQYRYALLIGLVGVALILLPGRTRVETPAEPMEEPGDEAAFTARLETVLSQIDGAGTVSCLLTCREGERRIYQTDVSSGAGGEVRQSTVLRSTGSGTQTALPVGTVGPTYQGVVVVCDGADSAQLRLELTRAVSALTGLSSDKIAVLKRKGSS